MNTIRLYNLTGWIFLAALFLISCQEESMVNPGNPELKGLANANDNARDQAYLQKNSLEMTVFHDEGTGEHAYNFSTQEVDAGWVTMKLVNPTHSDHFALFYHVPQEAIEAAEAADLSIKDYWHQVITTPFQDEFNPYIQGNIDYGTFVNNLVGELLGVAPWFFNPGAAVVGGPGITAGGHVSQTSVYLEPGTYIAECYIKDDDQLFHSYTGMLETLVVSSSYADVKEPKPSIDVTVSSIDGIQHPETIRPGKHTVAIHYLDQTTYSNLVGHNVQLVRFDNGYDTSLLNELGLYMNWSTVEGLTVHSPEGTTFMGGSMEMLSGTAYYYVNLKPGTYAWIAEVPDSASKGMLKVFTVPSPN
ncbi:hypothetical protein OO013_08280 [Mangrovivirga sp. M17]|uniref:Uncharacterized protein n=1 Tax=Mangrovivirga halotolerans TaxID=2993936 RepID=A0ABT3RR52_9BACT|nr:hypothetical protein [Mangrovivirga halotolerans]MCX2743859.1 hypothetical protein [Mangrovivirga halotolerans]